MLPPETISSQDKKARETSIRQGPFSTLNRFDEIIKQTKVTLGDRSQVALHDGLVLASRMIRDIKNSRGKVVLVGNGGSAAIASHQAVDLWKNGGIRAIAFNDSSLLTCIGNDLGYENVFAKPIRMFADPGDLLIAVSSSGASPNIINAVEMARSMSMPIIGYSGFKPSNPLSTRADLNFYVPSHSYGIVEVAHLLLIHAVIDEIIVSSGIQ